MQIGHLIRSTPPGSWEIGVQRNSEILQFVYLLSLEPFRSDLTALSRVYKQYLNRCLINKIKCWVIVMYGKEEMGGKVN